MSDYPKSDRFSHKASSYHRPSNNYRCGRANLWGKPCTKGPSENGACGGISECQPHKNGDRWECRRSGGACDAGPLPDGSCCNTLKACAPVPSKRKRRGQISLVVFILSIALIALTLLKSSQSPISSANNTDSHEPSTNSSVSNFFAHTPSLSSPGQLSDIHLAFTASNGCQECHVEQTNHSKTNHLLGFSFAVLSQRESVQTGCLNCHQFGGPASAPHNQASLDGSTQCQSCHTEHKGRFADLTKISNAQCASCHEKEFTSFKDHIAFSDDFPHQERSSIIFDHAKHFNFHFKKADDERNVPVNCTSCHLTENASNRVEVASFEQNCSACHQKNIVAAAKSELALIELPKLKLKSDQELAIFEMCGAVPGERFKASGKGRSTPFQDWLLGSKLKDVATYAKNYCELLQALKAENIDALLAAMRSRSEASNTALLKGLSPTIISALSDSWINNERYRPIKTDMDKTVTQHGWFIDSKGALKYRAIDHADPTAMAWISFAQQLRNEENDPLSSRLADKILAADGGFGACIKCHIPNNIAQVSDKSETNVDESSAWKTANYQPHHRFKFNHSAHLSFVGARNSSMNAIDTGCAVCHKLNPESNYADSIRGEKGSQYSSNFSSISNHTCSQCHNENSIKDDCTLCHQYHETPSFTERLNSKLGATNANTQINEQ